MPFNIDYCHYRNCEEQYTGFCTNVNPDSAGGAYGYLEMRPDHTWKDRAEYLRVPYADFILILMYYNYLILIICMRKILFYLQIYFLLDGAVLYSQVSNQEKLGPGPVGLMVCLQC